MRKWYLPLTVLGVASVAAVVLSERGRESVTRLVGRLQDSPEPFRGWNDAAQREMERLQEALDRLSQTLNVVR